MTGRPSTEAALRKYGRHIAGGCASLRWPAGQPCSCGYEESLAALRAPDAPSTEAALLALADKFDPPDELPGLVSSEYVGCELRELAAALPDAHLRMQERVIEWPLNEHGHPLTAARPDTPKEDA